MMNVERVQDDLYGIDSGESIPSKLTTENCQLFFIWLKPELVWF